MAGRKINTRTQKIIIDQYKEDTIPYFVRRVAEHNELWEQSLDNDEDED